ncbi:MAG: flagellar biosynthesis protein FlgC [Desulfobacterales bacterium]|nr:flagellar biosynthesis protein FlgC [Desulfobacterales bacterium]
MISSIQPTLSALKAFDRKMGVSADNVANVNTPGYQSKKATLSEGPGGGVETKISRPTRPEASATETSAIPGEEKRPSDVSLDREIPDMMVTKRGYQANLKALKAQDEMLGNALDILA